jgi:hypothetical protein
MNSSSLKTVASQHNAYFHPPRCPSLGPVVVKPAEPVACSATVTVTEKPQPRQFFIHGITKDGRTFRPSDWAERLAGAMSSFRPGGVQGAPGPALGYSPYCVPRMIGELKCVLINEALRDIEPMAWDFVMHFARDNELQVEEAPAKPAAPGA